MNSFPINKLCETYVKKFKRNPDHVRLIGVEKEIPVTHPDGSIVHIPKEVWPKLEHLGLKKHFDSYYTDQCIGYEFENGDMITTDAGYGTFELILTPRATMHEVANGLHKILDMLHRECPDLCMLGTGVHPVARETQELWVKKQRYEQLTNHFGSAVHPATITASDQVHIDISEREIIPVVNAICGISGFLIAIFCNSAVYHNSVSPYKAYRELFWDQLTPERTGLPFIPFTSLEDYFNRMTEVSCFMAKKDNQTFFSPNCSFKEFTQNMNFDKLYDQFLIHEGTIWLCARPREFGTIEVRPCCLQPWPDMTSVYAFVLGLLTKLHQTEAFLKQFEWKELKVVRLNAIKYGLDASVYDRSIVPFCKQLYEISYEGLKERNMGEEIFIENLTERLETQSSPADIGKKIYLHNGMKAYIEHYTYTGT